MFTDHYLTIISLTAYRTTQILNTNLFLHKLYKNYMHLTDMF